MMKKLWNDEVGALVSAEIVLVATILVIGMIVGLSSLRNSVVAELADVGAAIGNINQSYSYSDATGHGSATAGGSFADAHDHCEGGGGDNNLCVVLCTGTAAGECGAAGPGN
jgi:Flp pilus assembly pilin Flp